MPTPLTLDDVISIFTYIERMAKLMQQTRSNLTVAKDTILWVAAAMHIPVEPEPPALSNTAKERKMFYNDVIAERGTFDRYASRTRSVTRIPVNNDDLGPMFSMFRYAEAHCQTGHPGPSKILAILHKKGWTHEHINAYPMWKPAVAPWRA